MPHEETSPEVFGEIDENLRRAYEELLNEELPDRFSELIQRLRENDGAQGSDLSDGDGS